MSEMEQARIKSTNLDYLNKLTKLDLLVIDDFQSVHGLICLPITPTLMHALHESQINIIHIVWR